MGYSEALSHSISASNSSTGCSASLLVPPVSSTSISTTFSRTASRSLVLLSINLYFVKMHLQPFPTDLNTLWTLATVQRWQVDMWWLDLHMHMMDFNDCTDSLSGSRLGLPTHWAEQGDHVLRQVRSSPALISVNASLTGITPLAVGRADLHSARLWWAGRPGGRAVRATRSPVTGFLRASFRGTTIVDFLCWVVTSQDSRHTCGRICRRPGEGRGGEGRKKNCGRICRI